MERTLPLSASTLAAPGTSLVPGKYAHGWVYTAVTPLQTDGVKCTNTELRLISCEVHVAEEKKKKKMSIRTTAVCCSMHQQRKTPRP